MDKIKVCVNAGHGQKNIGFDSGAVGKSGLKESSVTEIVSRLVCDNLKRSSQIEALFVQDGDLQDVVNASDNFEADIFVSIHANSAVDSSAHGVETFSLTSAGKGYNLAQTIHKYVVPATGLTNRGLKTANYYVIKYTKAPACLVEIGFISNSKEEALMTNSIWLNEVATAITKGICEYLNVTYKEEQKEVNDVLSVAILKHSTKDDWCAEDIDLKLGGVAGFYRQGANKLVPQEAMSAKKLFVIGGATTKHPNEVLLSGNDKYDTAYEVGKWLKNN